MSSKNSNLSNATYGYDIVVATTQGSINATMKSFLNSTPPAEIVKCFQYNDNATPVEIDYDAVKQQTGVDPFTVTDSDTEAQNKLANISFICAFKLQRGLPQGYAPSALPDLIELGSDDNNVTYNMLCKTLHVVSMEYIGPKGHKWTNIAQPTDGHAWIFQATIPLKQVFNTSVEDLSPDVKKATSSLPANTFSVQTLIMALDKAMKSKTITIVGLDVHSTTAQILNQYFVSYYFNGISGNPALNYTIKRHEQSYSNLFDITDLQLVANPYMGPTGTPVPNPTPDQKKASTLCYECMVDGHPEKPARKFTWNWVDTAQLKTQAGAVAINKDLFIHYLSGVFNQDSVRNALTYTISPNVHFNDVNGKIGVNFSKNNSATEKYSQGSGSTILQYNYSNTNEDNSHAGVWPATHSAKFSTTYSVNSVVSFVANGIQIVTTIKVTTDGWLATDISPNQFSGRMAGAMMTQKYNIKVSPDHGDLILVKQTPDVKNLGKDLDVGLIVDKLTNFDSTISKIAGFIDSKIHNIENIQMDLLNTALNNTNKHFFPGGKAFAFQEAFFSDNNDLIATILYKAP